MDKSLIIVNAGVQYGSVLGLLLLLIYIYDLSNELSSNPRLFAYNTSLFPVVRDTNLNKTNALNNDLVILIIRYIYKK